METKRESWMQSRLPKIDYSNHRYGPGYLYHYHCNHEQLQTYRGRLFLAVGLIRLDHDSKIP